jgi:hypothetical protein
MSWNEAFGTRTLRRQEQCFALDAGFDCQWWQPTLPPRAEPFLGIEKIGRASCRERVLHTV